MKNSIYNNLIPLAGKYSLLYNSYTNMYLILTPYLKSLYQEEKEIKYSHPIFYQQLVKSGCLVDNSDNEIGSLKNRIEEIDYQNKNFLLTINPTVNCNFKCWYCYEEHIPNSKMSKEILEKTKVSICEISKRKELESFHLSFFGGEPLLYFDEIVLPIIEHYNKCCQENNIKSIIGFTSNGYLINDNMIEKLKASHVNYFQITLDGCKNDHDNVRFPYKGGSSYEKILLNIKKLMLSKIDVTLRINYTRTNLEKSKEIALDLENIPAKDIQYLNVNFQRVWQDDDGGSNELERQIKMTLEECIGFFESKGLKTSTKHPNYVWNSCYADKTNQMVINYNGDIFKCTARDFKPEKRIGHISDNGIVHWNEDKLKFWTGIRFTKSICHSCRIAPLCGGGCSQKHIENQETEDCLLGYNDEEKNEVILDQFYNTFIR